MAVIGWISVSGCAEQDPNTALSDTEKAKLSPVLQQVVSGNAAASEATPLQRAGKPVFLVFIRTNDPDALQAEGLSIGSISGQVVTARLTVDQLRQATRLKSVKEIQLGGQADPHQ